MNRYEVERDADVVPAVALFPLVEWTAVRVTGADRASFLHNMCTNDVRSLQPGQGCEAFFTDAKGKIIGHVFALAAEDAITLLTVPGQADTLIRHLDRYIIREDAQLADATGQLGWWMLFGRRAAGVLEACGAAPADLRNPWDHTTARMADSDVHIVRCELLWPRGFLIACAAEARERLGAELRRAGAASCTAEAWHAIRIESAWPLFGVDFDATHLPQEVGRDDQAIHFRKGCYLGQETIARIDALGHVNKRLCLVKAAQVDALPMGAELSANGQPAGRITSSCWSPALQASLALAMVRRGFSDIGAELQCGQIEAEIVAPCTANAEGAARP